LLRAARRRQAMQLHRIRPVATAAIVKRLPLAPGAFREKARRAVGLTPGGQMSAYQTVVVGTDGSDSSLRAVDRAGAIAADHGAKLIVATAHLPVPVERCRYAVPPGSNHGADYRTVGDAPFYAILHNARERAHQAGATN